MSDLILKKVRTTQPQFAVGIDWSNPITRGLEIAYTPTLERRTRELAKGKKLTYGRNIGNNKPIATQKGIAERNWTSPYVNGQEVTVPAWTNTTGEASVVILQRRVGTTASVQAPSLSTKTDASWFPWSDNTIQGAAFFNARWLFSQPPAGKSLTDWHIIVYTVKNGSQIAYWDGEQFTSNTLSSGFGVPSTLDINPDGNTDRVYAFTAAFSRVLNPAEVYSISNNPWQIFAPERRVLSFDSAVVSGDSSFIFSSRQAQSIVSNNARSISSLASTKTAQSAALNTARNVAAVISEKQAQTTRSSLSRFIQSVIATKQINRSNSAYDLAVTGSFNSHTYQGQKSESSYNRAISSSATTKSIQQSTSILGRVVSSTVATKENQRSSSLFGMTLDCVFSNYQQQAQTTNSIYVRDIGIGFSSRQVQKIRFTSGGIVITPSVARKSVIASENRTSVTEAENRGISVTVRNRIFTL